MDILEKSLKTKEAKEKRRAEAKRVKSAFAEGGVTATVGAVAGLVGGMGMAPQGNVGDDYAVFQPSHRTVPDIAGKGITNPIATILSAGMMLE